MENYLGGSRKCVTMAIAGTCIMGTVQFPELALLPSCEPERESSDGLRVLVDHWPLDFSGLLGNLFQPQVQNQNQRGLTEEADQMGVDL